MLYHCVWGRAPASSQGVHTLGGRRLRDTVCALCVQGLGRLPPPARGPVVSGWARPASVVPPAAALLPSVAACVALRAVRVPGRCWRDVACVRVVYIGSPAGHTHDQTVCVVCYTVGVCITCIRVFGYVYVTGQCGCCVQLCVPSACVD